MRNGPLVELSWWFRSPTPSEVMGHVKASRSLHGFRHLSSMLHSIDVSSDALNFSGLGKSTLPYVEASRD